MKAGMHVRLDQSALPSLVKENSSAWWPFDIPSAVICSCGTSFTPQSNETRCLACKKDDDVACLGFGLMHRNKNTGSLLVTRCHKAWPCASGYWEITRRRARHADWADAIVFG